MGKIFPVDLPDSTIRMHDDGVGNYWFYHKGSFPADEPLLYKHIISSANSHIEIWDPYFNVNAPKNRDHDVFDLIKPNVTILILTMKGLDSPRSYLLDIQNALKLKIIKSMNVRFGLRVINKGDIANQGDWFFHDRFLIIDQSEVYIIGGSVGWHITAQQSTGIFKVDNPETKQFIMSLYTEYWKQASKYKIDIQFLHT
jgi:hypothetical protein